MHCTSQTHVMRENKQKQRRKYLNPDYEPVYKKKYCDVCDKNFKSSVGAHYKTVKHALMLKNLQKQEEEGK